MAEANSTRATLTNVRLSYANIYQARDALDDHGNVVGKKFSTAILIPKDNKKALAALKKIIDAATTLGMSKSWGGKKPPRLKLPLRDGDEERPDDPVYANMMFINASSTKRPQIVLQNMQQSLSEDDVYSGCWVNVNVNAFSFNTKGNTGVGIGLGPIQKVRDDERLGGGPSAESVFSELTDEEPDYLK